MTKDITLYAKWEENETLKPTPPENVEITVKGLTVYISWEAVDEADKYQVVYCSADAENRVYTGIDTTLTSCSVELPEGNYIFAVQAMNRYGFSGKKEEYTVKVSQVSAIPSGVNINSSSSTVFMSWDAVYGADKYSVLYWPEGTTDYKEIITTATSCSVSLPDGEYEFKVQSMNRYGFSGWSETYQVKVSQIPAFPANVSISTSSSTVFMSWDAVYGADKYQVVYWNADAENREYKGIDTTATSCSVELPEGKYGFSVQSMNRYGYSGRKEEFLVTVSQVSAVPTNISIKSNGSTVLMSWDAVYGADKYSVLYWPEGTTDYKEIITTATSCSVSLPDGEYEFKVQSMNRYGLSGWSNNYYAIISTKTYNVTAIKETDVSLIERSFVNVNGILYSKASNAYTGGIIGYGNAGTSSAATTSSTIFVADALSASGTNTANFGYVIGYNKNNAYSLNKAYYNSDIVADSATDTTGTAIATRLIKMESFLETQLGLGKYTDVANIANDGSGVWVLRDGYLPELYYNCLNDITISKDIENGSITIDKTQAVDGEVVTVTATPNDGYILNKVYVDGIELDGTTFVVDGNDEVYVSFAEEVPVFDVSIVANENASASLVNADAPMLMSVMSRSSSGDRSITANDGEEIQVNAVAYSNYTVDSIYVNGVEVVGNSFILTKDSVVTMDVTSINTDVIANTNDAEDIGSYFAVVSGSVSVNDENAVKYIRYWSANDTETIYTTEVESGSGDYSTVLVDLEPETTYYYQMTEYGDVKSFTTNEGIIDDEIGGEDGEDNEPNETKSQPITSTTYKTLTSTYKFSIECSQALTTEFLAIACYDNKGKLLVLKQVECDGDTSYTGSVPIDTNIDYAKIFVWSSASSLKPLAGVEIVDITN